MRVVGGCTQEYYPDPVPHPGYTSLLPGTGTPPAPAPPCPVHHLHMHHRDSQASLDFSDRQASLDFSDRQASLTRKREDSWSP